MIFMGAPFASRYSSESGIVFTERKLKKHEAISENIKEYVRFTVENLTCLMNTSSNDISYVVLGR